MKLPLKWSRDAVPAGIVLPSRRRNSRSTITAIGIVLFSFVWPASDAAATSTPHLFANNPPVANPDTYTSPEDVILSGPSLVANDTDPDGDLLTIVPGTKTTAHGKVVINNDGTFVYTPAQDYNGTDTFTYEVCDNGTPGACSTGTVTITVTPVPDAPVAHDDVFSTHEDTPLTVLCDCTMINDYDPDGDPLTGYVVENPKHGTVTMAPNGTFTYTPDPDFYGVDEFYYVATDGMFTTPPTKVTINVIPVNDPPIAVDDNVTATEDVPSPLPILANDRDVDNQLTVSMVSITTPPQHGTISFSNGQVIYTSHTDYFGPDTFQYMLTDPHGATSNIATVQVTVLPVNDAPVAAPDVATTPEDTPVTIHVLANDTDIDNAIDVTSVVATTPAHGTVSVNSDGTVVYTPAQDYYGTDTFTYTVKDVAGLASKPAMVTVDVTPVNDTPRAVDDEATTPQNIPVAIAVAANDVDVDNNLDPSTVQIVTQPVHGTVQVNAEGVVTYTPHTDYLGEDEFTYTIGDAAGATSLPAQVLVSVVPVKHPPVAVDDAVTHRFSTDLPIDVLSNDYDPDGPHSDLVITAVTQPAMGSVIIRQGELIYHPEGTTSGLVTFTYTITDADGLTDTATVTIEYVYNPLIVSEGFSPNGDHSNDTWYIQSIEYFPNNHVKIFDRWGLLVYQKDHYENAVAPWDGRSNAGQQSGKLLEQGTYYYMLDVGGEIRTLSGFVMIVR